MLKVANGQSHVPDVDGQTCAQTRPRRSRQATSSRAARPRRPTRSPKGQAFATTPAAGSRAPQGSPITVFISSGPSQRAAAERARRARPARRSTTSQSPGFVVAVAEGRSSATRRRTTSSSRSRPSGGRPRRAGSTVHDPGRQVLAERPDLRRPAGIDMTEVVRLRVAVLSGGRSSEHEVSLASGLSVAAALDPERYDVVGVTIERDGSWQLEAPAAEGERLALDPGSNSRSVIPRAGGTLSQARAVGQIDVVVPDAARPLRRGRHPAGHAGDARACPTSARACWRRRSRWTRRW